MKKLLASCAALLAFSLAHAQTPTSAPVEVDSTGTPGKATVKMDFAYDGGGLGQGGAVTLLVNGKKVGEGRVERTQPGIFSVDDAADVGMDEGTPVVEDYQPRSTEFTGIIRRVVVDVKEMGAAEKSAAKKANAETERKIEEAK